MNQADIINASKLTHTVDDYTLNQKTAKLLTFAAQKNITIKPSWISFLMKIQFWYEVACFVVEHIKEIVEYINKKNV